MPSTVNGIGTHYYGKKNPESRLGVCERCSKSGELTSYDTMLWFVVLFIPIIPLGRKRVVDYCSACTGHRALPVHKWNQIGQEAIQEGMEEMATNPDDPEAAVKFHSALAGFNRREEADALGQKMATMFVDNVDVQMYLGSWHEQEGRGQEADACFDRALAADPNSPDARRAVGIGAIERGDLDRARELLSFMREPDTAEPAALFMLATAFQEAGRHDDAMAVFEQLTAQFPELAKKEKKFRQAVLASERALGRTESALPKGPFGWRKIAAAVVVAIAAAGFYLVDSAKKGAQTLHVVNALSAPAIVKAQTGESLTVPGEETRVMTLPEGAHELAVKAGEGPEELVPVEITNSFFQRWADDSVFILNVGRGAVFVWQQSVYAANPDAHSVEPDRPYVVDAFITLRDIDHVFEDFPKSISTESGSVTRRQRVVQITAEPAAIVGVLSRNGIPGEKLLTYSEAHLAVNPNDLDLLRLYPVLCQFHKAEARGAAFFEKGLARRPIAVDWHRYYQSLRQAADAGAEQALVAHYDGMLSQSPKDSALLYLRGRLSGSIAQGLSFFDRSIAADPKNAYAYFAKAYGLASRGELKAARDAASLAHTLSSGDAHMADQYLDLRMALGEFDALREEISRKLGKAAFDMSAVERLAQVLVAQGKRAEAQKAVDQFVAGVEKQMPGDSLGLADRARLSLALAARDFEAFEKVASATKDEKARSLRVLTLYLCQTKMPEAEKALAKTGAPDSSHMALAMHLGWRMKGDAAKAAAWLGKATEVLRSGGADRRRMAKLLDRDDAKLFHDVRDLSIHANQKALLCTVLAGMRPSQKGALLALAEKTNSIPSELQYPIEKAIQWLKDGK